MPDLPEWLQVVGKRMIAYSMRELWPDIDKHEDLDFAKRI